MSISISISLTVLVSVYLFMLGMSKTLDCINRNKQVEDLGNAMVADKLNIISRLLNVSLSVRCENVLS